MTSLSLTSLQGSHLSITAASAGSVFSLQPRSTGLKEFTRRSFTESAKCSSWVWWHNTARVQRLMPDQDLWMTEPERHQPQRSKNVLQGEKCRWSQYRGGANYLMMSTASEKKMQALIHRTPKSQKSPPHQESVYLGFSFRCLFPCSDRRNSSCRHATPRGTACCCGNHFRLCSHGRSWWCLLQCTRCTKVCHQQ